MKQQELLSTFIKFTQELNIDKNIQDIITQTIKKHPIKPQKADKKKETKPKKVHKKIERINCELSNLVDNSIKTVRSKDVLNDDMQLIEKENTKPVTKPIKTKKKKAKIFDDKISKIKEGTVKKQQFYRRNGKFAKKEDATSQDEIPNNTPVDNFASVKTQQKDINAQPSKIKLAVTPENDLPVANIDNKLVKSEDKQNKQEPVKSTRKSAYVALNAFKASEEIDKKLKTTNITKSNNTKVKRKRICMPKAKPKKQANETKMIEKDDKKQEFCIDKENVDENILCEIPKHFEDKIVEEPEIFTEKADVLDQVTSPAQANITPTSKPSNGTIVRENIAIMDIFQKMKNDVYNKTQIEPKRDNLPKKESFPDFAVKKDRSLEDIKKDVEILMPKTTYLFKDEYTRVENLAPKKTTLFGNDYFRKIRSNLLKKGNDPNDYISKTKVSSVDYNCDFDSFKGEPWTNNIDYKVKNQKHAAIEKIFKVDGPVDVIGMFPNEKNVCNDSPNKFVKKF